MKVDFKCWAQVVSGSFHLRWDPNQTHYHLDYLSGIWNTLASTSLGPGSLHGKPTKYFFRERQLAPSGPRNRMGQGLQQGNHLSHAHKIKFGDFKINLLPYRFQHILITAGNSSIKYEDQSLCTCVSKEHLTNQCLTTSSGDAHSQPTRQGLWSQVSSWQPKISLQAYLGG